MKKNLIILMITIFTVLGSCNDKFLDKVPLDSMSSTQIWSSDADATLALNGIYYTFSRETWIDLYSYIATIGPMGYTQIRTNWGINQYSGTSTPNESRFLQTWQGFYKIIRFANDIISNVPGNPAITPEVGDEIVGQAKFFRGLSYFYLLALYGGVPILEQAVPIEETYLARNTADEVRKFIISDFTDAIQTLPVSYASGTDIGRVTKGAAIAMLGKTYLYAAQWNLAAEQFGKLLASPFEYKLVDNFTDNFFAETENNSEKIFDIQYIGQVGFGSKMDNLYGYRNHGPNYGEDYTTASNIAVQVFTNKDGSKIDISDIPQRNDYTDEVTFGAALANWYQAKYVNADPRLQASVILPGSDFEDASGPMRLYWPSGTALDDPPGIRTTWPDKATLPIRKMVSEGNGCPLNKDCPLNFPLIRFADVLLMYGEAMNEDSGPSADVYDAINTVRRRADIVDLPLGLSQEDMRKEIRLERFRELEFETEPYFDVIRWKTAATNDPIFGLNGDIYDFRYISVLGTKKFRGDRDYLWAIPQSEIDIIGDKMEQNPNW